jgi:hypothetical protein
VSDLEALRKAFEREVPLDDYEAPQGLYLSPSILALLPAENLFRRAVSSSASTMVYSLISVGDTRVTARSQLRYILLAMGNSNEGGMVTLPVTLSSSGVKV